jgi:hypothetical protein
MRLGRHDPRRPLNAIDTSYGLPSDEELKWNSPTPNPFTQMRPIYEIL